MNERQSGAIPVRPRPGPAKAIGVLSLVLGALLVAASWATLGSMAFSGMAEGPYRALEGALQVQAAREHRAAIARLERLEASARSEEARRLFAEERRRREERGPSVSATARIVLAGGNLGAYATWAAINGATSMAIGLLMIASGAGLVQRVEWGRRLGLWTAGLNLARLVVLRLVYVVVVVPPFARQLGAMASESIAAQGGGMPAGMPNMTQLYLVMYTAWGLAVLVAGAAYQAVVLVVLTRPGVKAACLPSEVRGAELMRMRGAGR